MKEGPLFSLSGTFLALFPEPVIPSTSPWTVALAITLPVLFLLVTGGSIRLIRKLYREKEILSMEKEIENKEKEIARKELGRERVEKEKERLIKGKRAGGQFTGIQRTQLGQL